MKGWWNN